jgi:hypothetical protein
MMSLGLCVFAKRVENNSASKRTQSKTANKHMFPVFTLTVLLTKKNVRRFESTK